MEKQLMNTITSTLRILADLAFLDVSKNTQLIDYRNSMYRTRAFWSCYQDLLMVYGEKEENIPDTMEWNKFFSLFVNLKKEDAFRNLSNLSIQEKKNIQVFISRILDDASIIHFGDPKLFLSCAYINDSDKNIVHNILRKLNIKESPLY